MVYQVGRPAMFDGNMFLPETGTPIWKIDRSSTRLAVWLPDPLTVATWILKSLTMRRGADGTSVSRTATSLGDMGCPSATRAAYWLSIYGRPDKIIASGPENSGPERFLDRGADVRRALDDMHVGSRQRGHLLCRRALAAGDDRPGVAHPA